MNATRALLFDTSVPLWRCCLLAFPIALLPSLALFASANVILRALVVDPDHFQAPQIHATVLDAFGATVFSPVTETLLLAGGLRILSNFSKRKLPLAVASAVAWGCLHALFGALWFFGTVWSFFVFSYAYLTWRERRLARAFTVAAVPHALINLTVVIGVFVRQHT